MFVQDFKIIDASYEDVEACFVTSTKALLAEALGSSREAGERTTARVGPKSWPAALAKTVEIRLGPVRRHADRTLVGFSWEAHGGASLFPRLDADLEVAPFGADQTVLTIGSQGRGAAMARFPIPLSICTCGSPAYSSPTVTLNMVTLPSGIGWCP